MLERTSTSDERYKIAARLLPNLGKYYYVLVGGLFLVLSILNYFIGIIPVEYTGYILLFSFTCFTVFNDVREDVKLKQFLYKALPFIALVLVIFINGNSLWHRVLIWEMGKGIVFNMNNLFNRIPFNDASFARIFHPGWLTVYMKMVYNTGFALAVLLPLFRSAIAQDFKKMLRYTLSSHIFQVFIITPFYMLFYLQEVWYVQGHADMLGRNLSGPALLETTLNCFPSMHTSIAFAMFLLVIREKNRIFKWAWGIYCISVIYSTMYLEIHWVIDVIAGLLLGYATVKLADFVLAKTDVLIARRVNNTSDDKEESAVV